MTLLSDIESLEEMEGSEDEDEDWDGMSFAVDSEDELSDDGESENVQGFALWVWTAAQQDECRRRCVGTQAGGRPIHGNTMTCGKQVCGTDLHVWECTPHGFHRLSSSCKDCSCPNGVRLGGSPIPMSETYCGE